MFDLVPQLDCAGRVLRLDRPRVMGIVNVTPDSFSDGGAHDTTEAAVAHGLKLVEAGKRNETLWRYISGNTRVPGLVMRDLEAQIASVAGDLHVADRLAEIGLHRTAGTDSRLHVQIQARYQGIQIGRSDQTDLGPNHPELTSGAGYMLAGLEYACIEDHRLEVGVVADDHRRLAAQFQVGALEGLGRGLEDFLPGDDIAGQ